MADSQDGTIIAFLYHVAMKMANVCVMMMGYQVKILKEKGFARAPSCFRAYPLIKF